MGEICKIGSKLKTYTPSNPCLTLEFVLFDGLNLVMQLTVLFWKVV